MNNIQILSEEKILTIKNNQQEVLANMNKCKDNSWIKDFFKEENPYIKSKITIKDFDLDMNDKNNPDSTDFENAKRLYTNLKISESQACDERLWMGLTFDKFYDYMFYRYRPTVTLLRNKWLFQDTSTLKAQIFRQGLSMLWWYAYLTYDENNKKDPFELTEFAFRHKDFFISIYSRNFSGSKHITHGLMRALMNFEKVGGNITSKVMYNGIVKYVSMLGGAYIIDILDENEIYEKCYKKLVNLYISNFPENKIFKLE